MLELLSDQRAAAQRARADEPHTSVREIEDLQRAGMLNQLRDMLGDQLFGTDRHIDCECACVAGKQLPVAGVVGGTNARDASGIFAEQRVHDLAGDHVHFIAVRQRNEDIDVLRASSFQRRGM